MTFSTTEKSISVNEITPGMFVKFSYTKSDGSSGNYSILVVDPYVTSERAKSPQLHGYNADGVSEEQIVEFLFGLNYPVTVDVNNEEVLLPELSQQDAYDLLKSIVTIERPYRSFTLSNIGSVYQVTIELPNEVFSFVDSNIELSSNTLKNQFVELLDNKNYLGIAKLAE
jgi:hypothetical protein